MVDSSTLSGTLRVLPGPTHDLLPAIRRAYESLLTETAPGDVLVLKRHPEGCDRLRQALAGAGGSPTSPRVTALPQHASQVLEEHDPTLERLGYEERIELISLVIEGTDRELTPYLERASAGESFVRDVGQLLLAATRQQVEPDPETHTDLAACLRIRDRFHEVLAERGYVERPAIVPRATALLEANEDGLRDRVTDSFSTVLAVEFEEFRSLDRRYLATLTDDADLLCVGERNASIERVRVEPGRLETLADGLTVERIDGPAGEEPDHAAVTRYLATGEKSDETGTIRRLTGDTKRDQDEAVAGAVQAVVGRNEALGFGDVAVAVPRIERVPAVRRRLRTAGVPTDELGTEALVANPVVNELYAVVTLCAEEAGHEPVGATEREIARERLAARVDRAEEHLTAVRSRPVRAALTAWVERTDLKDRIAGAESWVDAREQFASVERILDIATFVAETDLVAADWAGLQRMLRRTIEYDAPHEHAVEANPPTGGVTVCPLSDLKFDHRPVVFLLDLVERTYPGDPHLTRLFPTDWVREMDAFPAVTDPTPATVAETFEPAERTGLPTGDAFRAYHDQCSRRALAVGCRAASRQLYWCSYEREAGGLRRRQAPSRFVDEAATVATLESVEDEAARHGREAGIDALLAEPWAELERVLGEASTGGDADLTETEAVLQEIAALCDHEDVDPELVAAVRSQFAFAAGEVLSDD